jgi:predicted ATPase
VGRFPSGLVTLLFTDIEGSTRLLHELGEEAYTDALAEHRRVLRDAFAANDGVEVDTQGDAFLVAFSSATGAVVAAAAAQAALADGQVKVRMGLHTGTPQVSGEGYVGEDVHLGARVAGSGHGGQVLLSKATRDLIDGLELRDLGEHRVKDFDQPVWIFQLGDGAFPPLKTISNTNLPRPASSFVGREREVDEVTALLRAGARMVTLTGPGGSGKTRLSIEAAAELVGESRNGTFWVGLATVRDSQFVLPAIARTLGAHDELAAHIGEKEMLLLLDNLEHVIDVAPDLAALVEACPDLRVLVTSRELLRVRGEVEFEVLPLADPDAVELFCARAGLQPSPAVQELCRRLDNMPLALELAAARSKALSPEQILERLSERLDLFKGGRDADPRQLTLRATIEWSHALLSPEEQALFAGLGVFAGGCTPEAAGAVCDADLDTIQSLVEQSLLRRTVDRFWMLETIREYAVEQLDASTDADAVRSRYAEFFRALVESANLNVEAIDAGRPSHIELVVPEQANVRSVLDWTLDADPELGLAIASDLEQFWVMQNPFEGARRFDELLDRAQDPPAMVRARALRCLSGARYMSGAFETAIEPSEQALQLYRAARDEAGEMTMLFRVGTSWLAAGEIDRARVLLEESLAGFRRLGKKMGECEASGNLASIELEWGDPELGRTLIEENIELAREVGFTWWEAGKQLTLSRHLLETGDLDDAERRACKALELEWQLTDRRATVVCLAYLAWAAAGRGDVDRAGRLWGAIETEERTGTVGADWETVEREACASALGIVAGAEFEQGRADGAKLSLAEAIEYALSVDSRS